jgi:hypothetical protein
VVVRKGDQLREAATIARRGAGDISAAQRRVMYAVEDAHNAGFIVGKTFPSPTPARAGMPPSGLPAKLRRRC